MEVVAKQTFNVKFFEERKKSIVTEIIIKAVIEGGRKTPVCFDNDYMASDLENIQKFTVIGQVSLFNMREKGEDNFRLSGLVVESEYRRQGIATELINQTKIHSNKIVLNCFQRPELIDLYQKCGFEIVGLARDERAEADPETEMKQIRMEWVKK